MKLMNSSLTDRNFQTDTSIKHWMTKILFVMQRPVKTATHNGNLHWLTTWFGQLFTGSMPCLDTLVLVTCVQHCKHDTIIHIYGCTLIALHVINVNKPSLLAPATVYCPIKTLLALLGRKLQLISLAHGRRQHHMVLWNSLLSLALIQPLPLLKLPASLKRLVTMSLLVLSTPGFLGILNLCKSSMTMGESLLILLFNISYAY